MMTVGGVGKFPKNGAFGGSYKNRLDSPTMMTAKDDKHTYIFNFPWIAMSGGAFRSNYMMIY